VTTPVIELASLPEPTVIEEVSLEAIITSMRDDLVARFPSIAAVIDLESEPARKLIEVFAYRETLLRARTNDAARARLLAFATGADLDQLGGSFTPAVVRMLGEDDERFRLRILLSGMARNVGSTERYRLAALDADLTVKDAIAYRLGRDPTVYVAILSTAADGVADPALLALVQEQLDLPSNRLVNSPAIARSAVQTVTTVIAALTVKPGVAGTIADTAVANLEAAFASEIGLGQDLTRDWIKSRLMVPGVYAVDLVSPAADVIVPPYEAPSIGSISVSIEGTNE
jgi:phage-related baseplate assembly protein